jgi:hypothetical protein
MKLSNPFDDEIPLSKKKKGERKQQKSEGFFREWLTEYLEYNNLNYNLMRLQVILTKVPADYQLQLDDSLIYIEVKEKDCEVKSKYFNVKKRVKQYERLHEIKKQFKMNKAYLFVVWKDEKNDIKKHDVYLADIDEFWKVYQKSNILSFTREQFNDYFNRFRLYYCNDKPYSFDFCEMIHNGKK